MVSCGPVCAQGPTVPPKPTSLEVDSAPLASQSSQPAAVTTQEPAQADVLIELKNVYKSFGSKAILRGANITIRRGEAVGIIGGSGTGKSTTLRIMAGLLMPDVVRLGFSQESVLLTPLPYHSNNDALKCGEHCLPIVLHPLYVHHVPCATTEQQFK